MLSILTGVLGIQWVATHDLPDLFGHGVAGHPSADHFEWSESFEQNIVDLFAEGPLDTALASQAYDSLGDKKNRLTRRAD